VIEPLAPLGQRAVDQLRLDGGAGEAVEHGALLRLRLGELLLDHAQDHAVGHERAGVHVLLCFAAERRLALDGGAQDVARRDLRQTQPVGEDLALGPLPRARRA